MATDLIRTADMCVIDDLFDMRSGYVLDFSDRTFAEFFSEELGVEINDPRYFAEGTSKAKRLRYFLKTSDRATRVCVLRALWDYRSSLQRRNRIEEQIPDAESEFRRLLERIGDTQQPASTAPSAPHIAHSVDRSPSAALKLRLTTATDLDPQQRGYEFERFLKDLFDINGLSGRSSFRLVGEQIDGSFELSGETYLLEAKWKALLTGVADLRAFNGKVEEKTAWTRGLFVSHTGFSEDGLAAFGRGKRIVCMDGLDLYDTLDRGLAFGDVVAKKVRRAAETGKIFVRVRDLFL